MEVTALAGLDSNTFVSPGGKPAIELAFEEFACDHGFTGKGRKYRREKEGLTQYLHLEKKGASYNLKVHFVIDPPNPGRKMGIEDASYNTGSYSGLHQDHARFTFRVDEGVYNMVDYDRLKQHIREFLELDWQPVLYGLSSAQAFRDLLEKNPNQIQGGLLISRSAFQKLGIPLAEE